MNENDVSTNSNQLATIPGQAYLTVSEIDLVKRTIAAGATDDELKMFLHDCRRQGTHPLDKLIHFSKRGGRYTPITSIDFMRTRAHETGECAGIDDPVFSAPEAEERWARVTVYRFVKDQKCAFTATARWDEYAPDGKEAFMWDKMPKLMLGKCAEALALRKAFPKQLHGIYEHTEMAQAGREDEPVKSIKAPVSELAEAVANLKARWIELELPKASVAQILKKKDLPEALASRNADWSGVDIAVVHDLLKEAGA